MKVLLKSGVGVLCLLAVFVVMAGDGAIEIWESTIITESGKYVLTRDISSGNDVIAIDADDVHLDLNGHTVTHVGAIGFGVWVRSNRANITIENGTVRGDGTTAFVVDSGVTNLTVRRIKLRNGRLATGGMHASVIADNLFFTDEPNASYIDCNGCQIINNVVLNPGGHGLQIAGTGNYIAHNTIRGCGGLGLNVGGNRNYVVDNVLSYNARYGLTLNGVSNVYRGNFARGNSGSGCTGIATTDFCDQGGGNTSQGDNYMPDQM